MDESIQLQAPAASSSEGLSSRRPKDRAHLQAAGRRKLEEFRAKRAASTVQIKKRAEQGTNSTSESVQASTSETPLTIDIPSTSEALRGGGSITPEPLTSPETIAERETEQRIGFGMPDDDPHDAMVTVLMHQVSNLMKEKSALAEENNQLRRDNEALQELVGFLSGEIEDEEGLTVGL